MNQTETCFLQKLSIIFLLFIVLIINSCITQIKKTQHVEGIKNQDIYPLKVAVLVPKEIENCHFSMRESNNKRKVSWKGAYDHKTYKSYPIWNFRLIQKAKNFFPKYFDRVDFISMTSLVNNNYDLIFSFSQPNITDLTPKGDKAALLAMLKFHRN